MSLHVLVIGATNVPNVEKFGESDPYATVEFKGISKKTEVIKSELNPTWNETFEFDLNGIALTAADELVVTIKDWERVGRNRLLGKVKVPLRNLTRGGAQQEPVTANLTDKNNLTLPSSQINLKLSYKPPAGAAKPAVAAVSQSEVVGDMTEAGGEEMEEEEEEEEESGPPVIDPATGQVVPKKKKKKRTARRGLLKNLSTKPTDFQVRVKIIEARQLQGANIQPVCKVTVYNQQKQTRVKKSTNSPYFNESFFFNFHCSPAELFDELIEFQVFNSRRLRSDALIGSFKCDIGMVFIEQKHALINKWLLLSDASDTMAGAKGYLKVCACVIGPGDEAPSFKAAAQDESDDIESNLLRPSGVQLRPATFTLKLFGAEDIPRMDPAFLQGVKKVFGIGEEQKELVDPYFVFTFAGKEIHSKIMYSNDHPDWNQILRLGLQFPSMCERIKFSVKDWDRIGNDDPVGTSYLPISLISSAGEDEGTEDGFLPTFGPCYVNFYGSTREYSDLPNEYEDLNEGKGTGVAYRGRVLVELTTELGALPEVNVQDIESDDVLRVQKFMRRRKYKLHATFLNATMVSAIDAPVEFEISIGNYGNKLDDNVPPCSSTTQPTNAVFDGCHYSFLPWGATKPCVVVDSHWEDISFRLEALNLLQGIVDKLEANIEQVRIGMKAKLPTPELAQLLISLLEQLVQDCRKPLPQPKPSRHVPNKLDQLTAQYRAGELANIREMAGQLREHATDVAEALNEAENFLQMIKNLAQEPQNSMPDVIVWMISGEKRIAYHRIPANEILYSTDPNYMGRHCGKLQSISLQLPGDKAIKDKKFEVPALIRVKLWLGLHNEEKAWHQMQTEGEMAVFAETYENEISIPIVGWTNKGPLGRPKWSDSQGKVSLKKDKFEPPPGWRWDSEWYISPELSMLFDKDAGHKVYMEDVYECHSRIPGGSWGEATTPWADVKGDKCPSRGETPLPPGWVWEDEWEADLSRAVDEDGWEYCVEATMAGYGPVEKRYHLCRRRRWIRTRRLVEDPKKQKEKIKKSQEQADGWEYAPLFNMKFHCKEHTMDMVRRRRWHRKMVAETPGASCFFSMKTDDDDDKDGVASLTAPRMFLTFDKSYKYQLRAYIYQARDLLAGDESGLSDPYARVSLLTQSGVTEKIHKSLCPSWDQTIIFEEFEIYGDPKTIESQPPEIFVEVFDFDKLGSNEFLGRARAQPMVKLDPSDARMPVLQWYDIKRGNEDGGELLAAFELFLLGGGDLPFLPPKKGNLFLVPNGIRPVMQRTGVEVLCWGVRNMKKFQLSAVTSPSIEFECGGHLVSSKVIKNTKKNPNFDESVLFFDVMLPREELYMPPMNIRVRDHRQFGRKPTVGIHVLKTFEKFRCQPAITAATPDEDDQGGIVGNGPGGDTIIDMPGDEKPKPDGKDIEELDWWSKYYASIGDTTKCRKYLQKGMDKVKVFTNELEKSENYKAFDDFCHCFDLSRGKDEEDEEGNVVGQFKGSFKVYPLPPDPSEPLPERVFSNLPPSTPEECVIRVYVICGIGLQPNDTSGLADPYVEIELGKKKVSSRDDYIPNSIEPVFGKMFELNCTLPVKKDLIVRIKDYDIISSDDLIGETIIDLENRFLSKHRATCGIPKSYYVSGVNQWRDSQKPKEILDWYCKKNHITGPLFYGTNSVKVGNKTYSLADFEVNPRSDPDLGQPDERLALHVLNTLPIVKEHVETRPLYNPIQPGIEQGKVQMWVDIFPKSLGPPGSPFNIEPRKPSGFVLRCIIWNTVDVVLDEESITGEQMSDIYVKGWISGIDEKQETDVHYRSLDGEGNFNWRFIFPFDYLPAEQAMVVKKKEHFWSLDETEQRLPPNLVMQIWDNDKFSMDDFLGTLSLNLSALPKPAKKAADCTLSQLPDLQTGHEVKLVSLFEQKRLKGFWPCFNDETGERVLTGKIEMELELVSLEEADERPAGQGQEEPNMNPHLDPPKRPETSFLWFTSPWKTFKFIIWRRYKWWFIGFLIVLLLIILIALFIYSFPSAFNNWILGN